MPRIFLSDEDSLEKAIALTDRADFFAFMNDIEFTTLKKAYYDDIIENAFIVNDVEDLREENVLSLIKNQIPKDSLTAVVALYSINYKFLYGFITAFRECYPVFCYEEKIEVFSKATRQSDVFWFYEGDLIDVKTAINIIEKYIDSRIRSKQKVGG